MIRSGLVSITFRSLPPEKIVPLVVKAGLEGIEWGGDVHVPHGDVGAAKEVRQMTTDAGIQVAAYGSYYRAGISENENLSFESVLAGAVELGAPTIRVWAGRKASADVDGDTRKVIIDDLRRISELAGEQGVTVSVEYHANTLTDDCESARAMLREAASDNLWLYWQPPNGMEPNRALSELRQVLDRVTNLHVFCWRMKPAGGVTRRPLSDDDGSWPRYLEAAKAFDRERFAMIEFVADDSADQFLADAKTLKQWLKA
ncbi:MAG: sugar phosphate isomerase/epimerase [Planctomycetes bacterium]|nr:sugar phosphate isomerase/epimerase [Planctomycetota bacterium]